MKANSQQPTAKSQQWRGRYGEALERARGRAGAARDEGRLIACGFTSNVDRVARLDAALMARLFAGRTVDWRRPRSATIDSVDDLLLAIAHCVAAGDGTDLYIREPAVQAWLLERMGGWAQVGGTGAQAASTLATLGFPVLLHLTGRSPEQTAALAGRQRIVLGTPDGLLPVDEAAEPDDPTMWHPALEYEAGLRVPLGTARAQAAPASNRILIGYDPVNAAFSIDPGYAAALADPAIRVSALLVSGFSQLHDDATRARVLHEAAAALAAWRVARPRLFVHLELGSMPDFVTVAQIVAALHTHVTSIGMNIDELRALLAVHGVQMAPYPFGPELVGQLRGLAAHYPTSRISVHTRECCLTLTEGDPAAERDALLFASLVAATRSRIAAFPELADLAATIKVGRVDAEGLAFLRSLGASDEGIAAGGVVVTPGIGVAGPAATVGLGDSFTGGVLAMLGNDGL